MNLNLKIDFYDLINRCSVNVTFWDSLAEELEEKLDTVLQIPKIIIISSAKITSWEGNLLSFSTYTVLCFHANISLADKIDIANVSATKFYVNYNHHSVLQLRQMYVLLKLLYYVLSLYHVDI